MTSGPATEADGHTKVGADGSDEVEVNEVKTRKRTAKSRIHDFC